MRGSPATETTCLFAPRSDATDAVEIEACSIRLDKQGYLSSMKRPPYIAARQMR
jgi:hypothetical protein